MANKHLSLTARLVAWLLLLIALALAVGGIWLLALGGSPYYLAAAVLCALTAALVLRGAGAAMWTYGLFFAGTLTWSLWEVGLDWWPLAARMDVPFIVGVLLLLPGVRRSLDGGTRGGGTALLLLSMVVFAAVSVATWVHDPHTVEGRLPPPIAGAAGPATNPAVPVAPGEWPAYGRTAAGQRYSPLAQITPANVRDLQVAWHYHTGDLRGKPSDPEETTYEVTPLKIGERLFLCTPHQFVIALDATTGRELWRHDPKAPASLELQHRTCRGLRRCLPGQAVHAHRRRPAHRAGPADRPALCALR